LLYFIRLPVEQNAQNLAFPYPLHPLLALGKLENNAKKAAIAATFL
jgi:hypothetical protein